LFGVPLSPSLQATERVCVPVLHALEHALQSPSVHLQLCVLQLCCVAGAVAAQLMLEMVLPSPSVHLAAARVWMPLEQGLEQEPQESATQAHACALQVWVRSVGAEASQ